MGTHLDDKLTRVYREGPELSYILITPIKNEAESLPQLKATVLNQTMVPAAWVIVDGASTDGSFDAATRLFAGHDWISVIRQQRFHAGGYENMAAAINEGYACARQRCADQHVRYGYVGKVDATPHLQPGYFATLHAEMEANPRLAFTCGVERLLHRGIVTEHRRTGAFSNSGYNDTRLYRRRFFEDVGGYPLTPFPDACVQLTAANRGWQYRIVERTSYVEPRLIGAKSGAWSGNRAKGADMYALGYHPLLALLHAIDISVKLPPHYQLVPMIAGYLSSAARRERRVENDEIRAYYGRQRLKELWREFRSSFDRGLTR